MDTIVKIEMEMIPLNDGESIDKYKPFKAHENDAAYDIMAAENAVIAPLRTQLVSAGFRIELQPGYEAQIRPRSGNALRKNIHIANSPGTIDCGYTGVVGIIIYNASPDEKLIIRKGDKIAQMVIAKLPDVKLEFVEKIDKNTERGENGFGSTDKRNN